MKEASLDQALTASSPSSPLAPILHPIVTLSSSAWPGSAYHGESDSGVLRTAMSAQLKPPKSQLFKSFNPLEMGIATHSSILAWRIPWTEETGGLPIPTPVGGLPIPVGSQRVGHD